MLTRPARLVRWIGSRLRPEQVELVRERLESGQERLRDRSELLLERHQARVDRPRFRALRSVGRVVRGMIEIMDPFFALGELLIRGAFSLLSFLLEALADI